MTAARNAPCPCGSGRKYKHCCGAATPASRSAPGALAQAVALLQAGQPAAAVPALRAIVRREPGDARALQFLGMALAQTGERDEGLALLRRAVAIAPAHAQYRVNLAVTLLELNEPHAAIEVLEALIARAPDSAAGYTLLGAALERTGRNDDACRALARAVALAPDDDAARNNHGVALLQRGDVEAARREFEAAIALAPQHALSHNNLGNALRALGDAEGSARCHARAVALDPALAIAQANLGRALAEAGRARDAIAHLLRATDRAPDEPLAWQWLADALGRHRADAWDASLADAMSRCLARRDTDPSLLAAGAATLLARHPALAQALRALVDGAGPGDPRPLAQAAPPLLAQVLEAAVLPDPALERGLVAWRAAALASATADAAPALRTLLVALAHQCLLSGHVLAVSAHERAMLPALEQRIAACLARREEPSVDDVALLACYRPLEGLGLACAPHPPPDAYARLLERHLREPLEIARLADATPTLTPIDDAGSQAVRAQYEQHPYPRWDRPPATGARYPIALRLRTLFPHARDALALPARPSILIAGCGTGRHAAITASLHPDSEIVAVDLSRASLGYAAHRARALGLTNVQFAQADLLRLASWTRRFDVIECVGVLHHLRDPAAGWQALLGVLAPGGTMKIGVYSALARRGVVAARALIEAHGDASDDEGIRTARARLMALPPGDPARGVLDAIDFYSVPGCRDLLFHVQEHRYTLPEIAGQLDALGLEFLGFELDAEPVRDAYRAAYPDDPAATSLANWAAFEARHPDTFAAMYTFWVVRA